MGNRVAASVPCGENVLMGEWDRIDSLIIGNKAIQAIKEIRERDGSSLKDAIDAYHERWAMLRSADFEARGDDPSKAS